MAVGKLIAMKETEKHRCRLDTIFDDHASIDLGDGHRGMGLRSFYDATKNLITDGRKLFLPSAWSGQGSEGRRGQSFADNVDELCKKYGFDVPEFKAIQK